ncbi:hypothetical protein AOQ84DRAFT_439506 [Glonium stellatum]|uniref:Uncharacterized protein n=1 Tax=Glonium stellatum TaxID=574774 RepID=A0A8E2JT47_9PEZI|nr:hypothetical protein AOQ84DRAFT_439506 [Glonium stellatum]
MSTEFLSLLPPPGAALAAYDRTKRSDDQPASIPQLFRDAMSVREVVYVDEQGVPLENELDDDDARSWHWVVYASVGTTSTTSHSSVGSGSSVGDISGHNHNASREERAEEDRRRSSATASRVPVGTIRLIPPPHSPNPYLAHAGESPLAQVQSPGATATATTTATTPAPGAGPGAGAGAGAEGPAEEPHDPHPDAPPPASAPLSRLGGFGNGLGFGRREGREGKGRG